MNYLEKQFFLKLAVFAILIEALTSFINIFYIENSMANKNLNKLFLAIILISFSFIISGCIEGTNQDPKELAKLNPMIKDFFDKHPNAQVEINHYTLEESSKIIENIRKSCNNPNLEPKDIYEVKVDDEETGFSAIAYIDWDNKKVDCSIKNVILDSGSEQEDIFAILNDYYNSQDSDDEKINDDKDANDADDGEINDDKDDVNNKENSCIKEGEVTYENEYARPYVDKELKCCEGLKPVKNDAGQDICMKEIAEDKDKNNTTINNETVEDKKIDEDEKRTDVSPVSTLYLFSDVNDPNLNGEGFFVRLSNGEELFIYNNDPNDNPHNIVNTARRFLARLKGYGKFSYTAERDLELHLILKEGSNELTQKVKAVFYKDLVFEEEEIKFYAKDIISVDGITTTTGGSVHLITVNMKNGEYLNINVPATLTDGREQLEDLKKQIEGMIGTDKVIIVDSLSYVDTIYTINGIRSGWVTFTANIKIE